MSENIRVENWCDHEIRFVEHEGNWYAVLKDICDALNLRTDKVKLRIDSLHITKLNVLQTVDFANQWTTTLPGGYRPKRLRNALCRRSRYLSGS